MEDFKADEWALKDSQIMVLTRDTDNYRDIWRAVNQIILPENKELYQPLIEGLFDPSALQNFAPSHKTTINLNCSFVYGLTSEKNRQSAFYIHQYPKT